jgi:ureidoglycolate hydrolase
MIGLPSADGSHGPDDIALDLAQGKPRFYLMRLEGRGLAFDRFARHDRVTQCLGTVDGFPWLIAVAPPGLRELRVADIRAFLVPPNHFVMLAHGTWHAGPYFTEPQRVFYNLELADTNSTDYTVCVLAEPAAFAQ